MLTTGSRSALRRFVSATGTIGVAACHWTRFIVHLTKQDLRSGGIGQKVGLTVSVSQAARIMSMTSRNPVPT